tara:strand:+ start:1447 stop:1944 length:498 start_codon:yes stop_codon:yes gene_type:complete
VRCPYCGALDTKVVDSRLHGDGDQVRRRRECTICNERFTTFESAELNLPRVVKSDGRRVNFDGRKLRAGIDRALEKRPVATEDIDSAINHITRKLMANGEGEISAFHIGELVMDELKALDQVAFVRFASVYRQFEDVNAFSEEIERLRQEPSPEARRKQMDLLDK